MPEDIDTELLRARIEQVRRNIDMAARDAGRDPREITLLAATKQQTARTVAASIACGIDNIGENRVQEFVEKDRQNAYQGAAKHFIGRLQRNKVRLIVGKVGLIHSGDRMPILEEINKAAAEKGIVQDLLLEIHLGGEDTKAGFLPEEVPEICEKAKELRHIRLRGLMSIPPSVFSQEDPRKYFNKLNELFLDNQHKTRDNIMDVLSMGMSLDYPYAISCGATIVRIGTAIFGSRIQ